MSKLHQKASKTLRCPHPRCPHPHLGDLVAISGEWESERADGVSKTKVCDYVFSRAYHFRGHLRSEHARKTEFMSGLKEQRRMVGTIIFSKLGRNGLRSRTKIAELFCKEIPQLYSDLCLSNNFVSRL